MWPRNKTVKNSFLLKLFRSSQGFTLIEVLVSVIILAFGLVIVAEGMVRTEQAYRISENMIIASMLAEQKLAEAELQALESRRLNTSSDQSKETFSGKTFDWQRSTYPFFHSTVLDQTKVNQADVTLEWKDGPVRTNKQIYSTLILNPEKKK